MARKTNVRSFMQFLVLIVSIPFFCLFYGCTVEDEGTDGSSSPPAGSGAITFSIVKVSDHTPTTSVSADSPVRITATARDGKGNAITGKVMSFTSTSDLTFNPTSGAALTDGNGESTIIVNAGNSTGATTIKASVTDATGVTVSGETGISVPPAGSGAITFSIVKVSDHTPTTSVSADSPVRITATARDGKGKAITGKVMSFTSTSDLTFNPTSGAALTDGNGESTIIVNAGNSTGATTIKASVTDATGVAVSGETGISVLPANLSLSSLTINPATISAGGSASVSITVKDSSGNPYLTSVPVSFTSDGTIAGRATISAQVYTINGVASATYRDINFSAVDTITATLSIGGTLLTKTGTINVQTANAGSIAFVSATPANIALKGTGGAGRSETSIVKFKVLDTNGNPIKKTISFSLTANSYVGGLALTVASAESDPVTGLVQTLVQAGTASTPVRVSATVVGSSPAITTGSDGLVVSTGIPDQQHFSISATTSNIEGWNIDGVTTDISVLMADHFGNPVPDGSAVSFWTSGGSIGPACTTTGGACKVKLTSQNPRPTGGLAGKKGRAIVLAYALGEETFVDLTGNGSYDGLPDTFTDLPEPWLDTNENGVRDANEPFVDTNSNGVYDLGDTKFNGILRTVDLEALQTIHVRGLVPVVFSGSNAVITIAPINLDHCITSTFFNNTPVTFTVTIVDENGNVLPAGTTIVFATTKGTILTDKTLIVPSTATFLPPPPYAVTMQSDALQFVNSSPPPAYSCFYNSGGIFTVKVTTPSGVVTSASAVVTD